MLRLRVLAEKGDGLVALIDARKPAIVTAPYNMHLIAYRLDTVAGNTMVGSGPLDFWLSKMEAARFSLGTDETRISMVKRIVTRFYTPTEISEAVADLQEIARGMAGAC